MFICIESREVRSDHSEIHVNTKCEQLQLSMAELHHLQFCEIILCGGLIIIT